MLSVIIVNFKNPPLLRLCLASLARTLSRETDFEVVVVDSQTSIETQNVVLEEFVQRFRSIKLLPFAQNIGYTRGVNEGMRAGNGDYFLILNPDIVILPSSVEQMVSYLTVHPEIGLLGPQLLNFDDTVQASCFRYPTPLTVMYRRMRYLPFARMILDHFLMKDANLSEPRPVDWLMGSAFMASRQAVNRVGPMDERLFLYMSDVDWPRRFWENGYAVMYYPHARMYHYLKRDSKGRFGILDVFFKKETRWHIRDAFRYFQKYGFFNAPDTRRELASTGLF